MTYKDKCGINSHFYCVIIAFVLFNCWIFQSQAASSLPDFAEPSKKVHQLTDLGRNIEPSDLTHFNKGLVADTFRVIPELQISGSHQYTFEELDALIEQRIPHNGLPIIFIDLRREPHLMLDKKTTVSVQAARANAYKGLRSKEIRNYEKEFSKNFPGYVTEESCVKEMGAQYLRIAVTDVTRPEDSDVDEFITFLRAIKDKDYWLHFHCLAGLGRTTTFMAMYEMIKTASSGETSFEDILASQHQIGGANLSCMWYSCGKRQWLEFLENFYDYAEKGFDKGLSWSQWVAQNDLEVFHEQPSITPWWSLSGFMSHLKFAAMISYMEVCQVCRYWTGVQA